MLLSNVDWIIRWKVITLYVWLFYLEVMVEENCTETRDDKPEEEGECWNLWNVEGVENCRQNNCSSVGKYDRKETSIEQIPWQFFCFPHHFVKNFSVVYDVLPFSTITVRCGRAPWACSTYVKRATSQHSQNQLPEPRCWATAALFPPQLLQAKWSVVVSVPASYRRLVPLLVTSSGALLSRTTSHTRYCIYWSENYLYLTANPHL